MLRDVSRCCFIFENFESLLEFYNFAIKFEEADFKLLEVKNMFKDLESEIGERK